MGWRQWFWSVKLGNGNRQDKALFINKPWYGVREMDWLSVGSMEKQNECRRTFTGGYHK